MPICIGMERGTAASGSPARCVRQGLVGATSSARWPTTTGGTMRPAPRRLGGPALQRCRPAEPDVVADISMCRQGGVFSIRRRARRWCRRSSAGRWQTTWSAELVLNAREAVGQRPRTESTINDQGQPIYLGGNAASGAARQGRPSLGRSVTPTTTPPTWPRSSSPPSRTSRLTAAAVFASRAEAQDGMLQAT